MRQEISLNNGWIFCKGDFPNLRQNCYHQSKTERKQLGPAAYNFRCETTAVEWHGCDLPHDFIIDQDNDPTQNSSHGYFRYDNAWYRKRVKIPEGCEDKRLLLRFDGIAGNSTIYLNGCLLHHNFSSYNTFELDITDLAYRDRDNILAVYVNTEEFEGWWYQGGGIYRDVHLVITEPVAIDLWGVYAPATKIGDKLWQIDFETTIVNTDFALQTVSVESSVLDAAGNCVATASASGTVTDRERGTLCYRCIVSDPLLWDCDNPNVYTVKTVLKQGEETLDESVTRVGFRTVEFNTEKGLLLNGKKTIIKGVCAHQDFGLTGLAVPANIAKYKIQLIKEMGANGYRTSHYQQTAAYLDACDEQGLLVMDETRRFETTKESLEQLESLLKRDRNRPSVILWSTSNEEPYHGTDTGRRLQKSLAAYIRKFDKNRAITAAVDRSPEKSLVYGDCDIIGINYNQKIYDAVHENFPDMLVLAAECCATGTSRDWHFPTEAGGRIRDKDVNANDYFLARETTWKHMMERPYVIGGYQWDAVEHRGEAAWPAVCSKSGAIDLFFQKKGAFYQNKSYWTEEPMVHIVPHWNFFGMEGQDILVTVYTNCDAVELLLNGESLGKKEIELYGHGEWNVPYASGTLEARAYRNGELMASHERTTTGKAVRLHLTMDNECVANGSDLALFTCECLDENGNMVPDANDFVRFSVEKPAKLIGTGSDHTDHTTVTSSGRKMYMGKIRIAVKPEQGQEKLTLTAIGENCGCTSISVKLLTE